MWITGVFGKGKNYNLKFLTAADCQEAQNLKYTKSRPKFLLSFSMR
jgi:hypothetical protein